MEPVLQLEPGKMVGLLGAPGLGLTRVGLSLLAASGRRSTVAVLDVRGWFCPLAAWESGIPPDHLVVVRCADRRRWPQVMAALLEGIPAVYAEVPQGIGDGDLRRLTALARARSTGVVVRPLADMLPPGVAHLTVRGRSIAWSGAREGAGRLESRRLTLEISGRAAGGMEWIVEMEDDGADFVRVVPGLVAPQAGRAVG